MSVKQIHIEKYDFEAFEKEQKPYVMLRTDVIQNMPPERIREGYLWIYLESLPETWKPNKAHLTKHFDISDRTYERWMSWLNSVGLIQYRQKRLTDGSFGKGILVVLNGSDFNPSAVSTRTAKIGGTVVNRCNKAQVVQLHRTANLPLNGETEGSVPVAHIKTTKTLEKEVKKKTNTKAPVPVFSDTESVKNHILLITANRKTFIEDDTIDQIVFYIGKDKNYDSVIKKINIALKLVREGRWNIPQGYKGITSQSIREKEELYENEKNKEYSSVKRTNSSPTRLSDMLKQFKDGLNANQGAVPEKDIQYCNTIGG